MSDAFIIETSSMTAGIVAAQGQGFCFYASHPSMFALEGAFFDSLKSAQRAVERLERAAKGELDAPNDSVSRWRFPPTIAA